MDVYPSDGTRSGGRRGRRSRSFFALLRDPRGSQQNAAKILAGLNPNLLKQLQSLPLKSSAERRRGLTPFLPPVQAPLEPCKKGETGPSRSGWQHRRSGEEFLPEFPTGCSHRGGGFLRSPWRTTERLSERVVPVRDGIRLK